jgi:GMP synthase (glutamine-hydrolysing)
MPHLRKPLLLLQCEILATSLPALCSASGETDETFLRALGVAPGDDRSNIIVSRVCLGETPPQPRDVAGVVITGSSAMVSDADAWIADTSSWLARAFSDGIPLLGVCFGHQLLAHTLGGRIAAMPQGPQYKSIEVHLTEQASDDLLFRDLPSSFAAQSAHYQTVTSPPPGSTILAEGASGIQALRFGPRAWGVQFHPEFRAADHAVLIKALRPRLSAAGCNVDFDLRQLAESHDAARVLPRFHEIATGANTQSASHSYPGASP